MTAAASSGRVQRSLERLYERRGSRALMRVGIAFGMATVVAIVALTVAVLAAYLDASGEQALRWLAIFGGGVVIAIVSGVMGSRGILRTVGGWSVGGAEDAAAVWPVVESGPRIVIVRMAALAFALVIVLLPTVVGPDAGLSFGESLLLIPIVGAAVAAEATFGIFLIDVFLRPILQDVGRHLPEGFEPGFTAWRLKTKAVAPTPILTLFGGITVGAFAGADDRVTRIALVLGIALAVAVASTLAFSVISRSVLEPLDELEKATRRVAAGDLGKPATLLTADDLGALTMSFNRMMDELRASRARIVAAADDARRRVERDLHDGAQQRFVLLGLRVSVLARKVEADPEAQALAAEIAAELELGLEELRTLAHGIYPVLLETDGLPAALRDVSEQCPIPVRIDEDGVGRHVPEVETAVYFCCLEALQNAAKHAGPGARVTVRLRECDGLLAFEIADDGVGFDQDSVNGTFGLLNMADRIGALGGTLRITSRPGAGTVVSGEIGA